MGHLGVTYVSATNSNLSATALSNLSSSTYPPHHSEEFVQTEDKMAEKGLPYCEYVPKAKIDTLFNV